MNRTICWNNLLCKINNMKPNETNKNKLLTEFIYRNEKYKIRSSRVCETLFLRQIRPALVLMDKWRLSPKIQ